MVFARGAEQQLIATYVANGRVKIVYHHFAFLGQESNWAAEAAECAGESGKFWELHDRIFASQAGENRGAFSKDNLKKLGASLGAYHAANTLFRYPHMIKRCYALSGVYDLRRFMGGMYDDNFYFNNPVDYLSNLSDPWVLERLARCEIHIVTGSGPWENSAESYRLSRILASRGIPHHLDDWGPEGGHDWPYWKRMMREYLGRVG